MVEEASVQAPGEARPRLLQWKDALFLLLAGVVVAVDQVSKRIVENTVDPGSTGLDWGLLRIVHFTNSGAAFGLFQDAGPLLAVVSAIGMAAILIYLFNPSFADPVMRTGLALMLGGAIGNLLGRAFEGEVVDFIKIPHWPAFNVADSAITIGVLFLMWSILRESSSPSNAES